MANQRDSTNQPYCAVQYDNVSIIALLMYTFQQETKDAK